MMESLFTYGTLQDPDVQTRVFGRVVAGMPDTLPDFRRSTINIDGSVYFIAVADIGQAIDGQVIEVTANELQKIDIYEGPEYRRIHVRLATGRAAWVYCE